MGFDDLRSILLSERETGKLLQISPDIFDRTHAEIAELLKKVYAIEDPLSDEARALIEETIAIKETMHELFAIRSRKILALALMHAEGNYYDREEVKRMLPAEHGMFDRIAAGLEECQGVLLHNTKQPLVPVPVAVPAGMEPAEDEWGDAAYEEVSPAAEGPVPSSPAPSSAGPTLTPPYMLVRVLGEMDTFMGVDGRIYSLTKGDIVTLPERNASVLSDRNIVVSLTLPTCK
jgi:DNA replication factor GINS